MRTEGRMVSLVALVAAVAAAALGCGGRIEPPGSVAGAGATAGPGASAGAGTGAGAAAGAGGGARTVTLYGATLPVRGGGVAILLDISGSMDWGTRTFTNLAGQVVTGTRLEEGQNEIARAIDGLDGALLLRADAFDCSLYEWMPASTRATPAAKSSAQSWVLGLQALGGTGTGPAVEAVLGDADVTTLVLVSDGDPNCSGIVGGSAQDHLDMIRNANARGVTIHTIGVEAYGGFEQFMRDVAASSGGRYVAAP